MTKSGIVCSSMPGPWGAQARSPTVLGHESGPDAVSHFSAFAMGVARVNASIPVHVGWAGNWRAPIQDILVTRYMHSIGCGLGPRSTCPQTDADHTFVGSVIYFCNFFVVEISRMFNLRSICVFATQLNSVSRI